MSHRSPWTTAELVELAVAAGELKPGRPKATVFVDARKAARAEVERARKALADAEARAAALEAAPPGLKVQKIGPAGNLAGKRIGALVVVGYLCPGGATPWWLARCVTCKARRAYRGSALRHHDRKSVGCRSCGARRPL